MKKDSNRQPPAFLDTSTHASRSDIDLTNGNASTVYGRLLESVHISGYTAARACDELEWLLEQDRWRSVGPGFENGDKFIETINLADFKLAVDRRKRLAQKLSEIQGTQRAIGKALGANASTINRDVANATKPTRVSIDNHEHTDPSVADATPPALSQSGADAAEQLKRQQEFKDRKEKRTAELQEERSRLRVTAESIPPSDRYRIYHADMRSWHADRQFDWIITDPPYPREFLPLYESLALRAKDWLKDGGLLVAMCGQSYLDGIVSALSKHLDYYWIAAYLTPGQPTPLRQVNVNTTWKPLLIFSKGEYRGKIFGDVLKSDLPDKDFHEWGQSLSGMQDIVSKLTLPGESILDPFCGAGTTGIAALRHGCLFYGLDLDPEHCQIARARLDGERDA